ncbi:Asparagine synthase [uncultured archaeon]|nr:Asparagine synthase [uncultured archaeon]
MFFISITKNGVAQNFQSVKVEEFNLHSSKITVITDKFLSDFITEPNGFSVVESPLISTTDFRNIIFSKVSYDDKNDKFNIFKSTDSGRPIYYHINPKGEFFCSTHISMLRSAGVPIAENTDVLPEFFVFRFIMSPNTLYKDIFQLCSGDQLQIKIENNKVNLSRIHHFTPPEPRNKDDINVIIGQTLNHLNNSIKLLEPSHNKISILFSGGLDSSILFKICQKNFKTNSTYSTGFPFENPKYNIEKEYSSSAAYLFKTKHFFLDMTSTDYLHGFIEAISKAELPIHHLQSVPIYLLFKKIPQNNNIVISGLGGDDLFGTTTQYNQFHFERNFILKLFVKYVKSTYIKYLLSALNKNWRNYVIIQENYKKSTFPITDSNNLVWSIGMYGSEEWTSDYFNKTKEDIIKNRYNEIIKFHERSIYDIISILLFLSSASTTQDIWSKLGESDNKILCYPFTNIDVINYAFSIPWNIKLKKPKNILRLVANQVEIPEEIINRQKSGFGINPELWAQKGSIFESLLPLTKKIFNEDEIRKMQSSESKKAMTYWNMLNYSIWKRICINNEPLDTLIEEIT